jgi:hypothetical protein
VGSYCYTILVLDVHRVTGGLSERTIVVSDPGISSSHGNVRSEESSRLIRDDAELGLPWWMDGTSGVRWWLSMGHRKPVLTERYDRRPRPTTTNERLLTYDLRLTTYDLRLTTYDLRLTTYDLRLTTATMTTTTAWIYDDRTDGRVSPRVPIHSLHPQLGNT